MFAACDLPFKFHNTKEIKKTEDIISQQRAVRAIHVGLGIRKPGYNIYVAGYQGTGKTSVIRSFLEKWSKDSQAPSDWIYVYDFQKRDNSKVICLDAGEGHNFSKYMDNAIGELRRDIPKAFQSEDYENSVNSIIASNNDKQAKKFVELEKIAKKMNFHIKSSTLGIETIPNKDGRPITDKEYSRLSEKVKQKIEAQRAQLEPIVLNFARKMRAHELKTKEILDKLEKDVGKKVVDKVFDNLFKTYKKNHDIIDYLHQARENILDTIADFLDLEESQGKENAEAEAHSQHEKREGFRKYKINCFVDNRSQKSAPVIIESNPSYFNLFGKIEKSVEQGFFTTDFTMIQAGSIHKANGGYLVLNANDLLKAPYVWDKLKRVLRNRLGYIEEMDEHLSMFPSSSALRPEPIPLDLKVILIGSDEIYHLLFDLDEDFAKIFKIKADFDYRMPKTNVNMKSYVSFIATRCHKEDLLHFDRSAVSAVIEYGSRLVEDQSRLSSQFSEIKDLIIEADFLAREDLQKMVNRDHVERALEQKSHRVNLYEGHILDMIAKKEIMVSLDGQQIGQVNGLSVYDLSDHTFGKVGRITCTISVSDRGVFNIERASKLSGNIHDKGIYILTGFLTAVLARQKSLGISASLCFEQSYGMIDGDSATTAELTAIFSALSGVPISQNYSITGSLNQMGEIQPVGGINEKIEGFYKICKLLGKGKSYGILIPHQNCANLMLNRETRRAVSEGYLRIYPIKYFWEAFELVTSVPLGIKTIHDTTHTKDSALDLAFQKLSHIEKKGVLTKHD